MLAALIPEVVNSALNQFKIGLLDGSFSDSNGQHSHYISKRIRGRQQKMHGDEKIVGYGRSYRKLGLIVG